MKYQRFICAMLGCMIAVFVILLASCESDVSLTDAEKGSVEVVITDSNGVDITNDEITIEVNSEQPSTLIFSQTSSYADNGTVYTVEPKATVTVTTDLNSLRVLTLSELTDIVAEDLISDISGPTPILKTSKQVFNIGGQSITFDTSYEIYNYTNSSSTLVSVPYLSVKCPGSVDVETSEITSGDVSVSLTKVVATKATFDDLQTYDVVATFEVEIESNNTVDEFSKTLTYNVTYSGVVGDPVVVNTRYEHYMDWREAHDNIPFCGYACVDVIEEYDDGSEVTTTYQDYGHLPFLANSFQTYQNKEAFATSVVDEYTTDYVTSTDYRTITVHSYARDLYKDINVYDLVKITNDDIRLYNSRQGLGVYEDYGTSLEYIDGNGKSIIWKYYFYGSLASSTIWINDQDIFYVGTGISPFDQFLNIDGTCIYFEDYWATYEYSVETVDIEAPEGYEIAQQVTFSFYAYVKDEVTYCCKQVVTILYEYGTE